MVSGGLSRERENRRTNQTTIYILESKAIFFPFILLTNQSIFQRAVKERSPHFSSLGEIGFLFFEVFGACLEFDFL